MTENLAQNWPIFILVGGFIVFVFYAINNSRQQEKKNKEAQTTKDDITSKK